MFDFNHIAPLKTAKLTLQSAVRVPAGNPKPIILELKHAGEGNPGYESATAATPRGKDRMGMLERMTKIFSRYVIVGWENVGDTPFSPEACEELLRALLRASRTDVLDYIAIFAREPDNFHDPITDAADLGKG